ncbi:MAG TPA: hypothetical protein VGM39_10910 [Kofleriaceae bacterium]|jgi:hypothetical protein
MRLGLALACALPVATTGCSLIYNPNNIDKPDPDALQAIDAEIVVDADPAGLTVETVTTPVIYEGQGVDGAKRGVVVVTGTNFGTDAKLSITDHATGAVVASLVANPDDSSVAGNHKMIVLPVTANIDANDEDIRLDVHVTQDNMGTPITRDLTAGDNDAPVLVLRGLPAVDDMNADVPISTGTATGGQSSEPVTLLYAKINAKKLTITGQHPLVLRTISSLSVVDLVDVSGKASVGVAGGGGGGAGGPVNTTGTTAVGPCGGGGGVGGGLLNAPGTGASGGFVTPAAGGTCTSAPDENLSDLTLNIGSGGGGGGGQYLAGATGGVGGASGGTLQIDSGAALTLMGGVSANGAAGATVNNAGTGGAGSAGAVLLRARGMLTAGPVTALPGAASAGTGRIRYDSGVMSASITTMPTGYRGPALSFATQSEILKNPLPALTVYGTPAAKLKLTIDGFQNTGEPSHKTLSVELGDDGQNTVNLGDGQNLFRGVNTICAVVDAAVGMPVRDEAKDCISVVYVFQDGQ